MPLIDQPTVSSDASRKKWYEDHKKSYPFEIVTKGVVTPRPEQLNEKYGLFCRIPFPERDETIWLFTSREQSVMFQTDYHGRFG